MPLSNLVWHIIIYFSILLYLPDTFIQKTKKLYLDTRSQRNMSKVSEDLQDIQKIMSKNIQEILGRGEKIASM